MGIRLAFYHPDNGQGSAKTGVADLDWAANDPMADRPNIPATVITWPQQASDRPEPVRATPLRRSPALAVAFFEAAVIAALFASLVAMLIFGVVAVAQHALSGEAGKPVARRVATVETRILSLEPVAAPATVAERSAQ